MSISANSSRDAAGAEAARLPDDVDVLIVGGGPVGLSASLALSQLGISSLLVERHPGTTPHPKATHLSTRTMEVFRSWGIADEIRTLALPLSAHGLYLGSSLVDPDFTRHTIWQPDPSLSPERSNLVSQEVLEPVLRQLAEDADGDVRFNHRLVEAEQDADGIRATIEATVDGALATVRARYLIGADGAASGIRTSLGIDFPGHTVHDSVNIRFHADLTALLADRNSAFYYIQNDVVRGLMPVLDNVTNWRLHLMMAPGETLADYESTERQLKLIRAAIGVDDIDIELLPIFGWSAATRVADHFRDGRIFLAGDAAHVNTPSGGLGMNCGIQDVHNLVWKIAGVVSGQIEPSVLDTYEPERRPVAVVTVAAAELNHEFEAAPVHTEEDRRRKHERRRQAGIVLGQHYEQGAFVPDGTDAPAVADPYVDYVPTGRPGHRAPHVWLQREGERLSCLDLLSWKHPTLFVGPDADIWRKGAPTDRVRVITVGGPGSDATDAEADGTFLKVYGISPAGAVLVRQDGVVAMRQVSSPAAAETARADVLRALFATSL